MRGFWGQHRPHGHPAACPLRHGTVRGWGVPVGRAGGLVIPSRRLFPCPVTRGWWPRRCGSWWERSATGRTRCCPPDTAQVAAGRAGCLGGLQPCASGVFLGQSRPRCCSLPPPAQLGHRGALWVLELAQGGFTGAALTPCCPRRLPAVDQPLGHGAAPLPRPRSFQGSSCPCRGLPRHRLPALQRAGPHLGLAGLCPVRPGDAGQPPGPSGEQPGGALPLHALPGAGGALLPAPRGLLLRPEQRVLPGEPGQLHPQQPL